MRRALPNPYFSPPSFTLPGEIIELRHVLLCHLFETNNYDLVTKTMVPKK